MKDIKERLSPAQSITPAVYTTAQNGSGVDLQGFSAALVLINVGTYTDGTWEFEVQEAEDDGSGNPNASTWAAVADVDLRGAEPIIDAVGESDQLILIGVLVSERHLRVVADQTGSTTTGADFAATIIRGLPRHLG